MKVPWLESRLNHLLKISTNCGCLSDNDSIEHCVGKFLIDNRQLIPGSST